MARSTPYDLVVIGGGINGCGIAADASGRGLSVLLAERGDLACGTSSASSKLIHGGLRYLEHFEFRLVREALAEREVLLGMAPHIVWPLRFLLPEAAGQRPAWMIGAGLFLYDHLARRRRIPGSRAVSFAADPAGRALRPGVKRGFSYWDCWVDDARLVVLNARLAAGRGAEILTRSPVEALRREGPLWRLRLGSASGGGRDIAARAVVNAAGPWAGRVARLIDGETLRRPPLAVRLVKGSHIVVPRIQGADDAFLFQSADGRVVFALPFESAFTLIGTTDVTITDDHLHVACTEHEVQYLCDVVNGFLRVPIAPTDVVWSFAGVRPLDDSDGTADASSLTRDYRLLLDDGADASHGGSGDSYEHRPPLIHVVGGKITTYRRLAEAALTMLEPYFQGLGPAWTGGVRLPGGDLEGVDASAHATAVSARRPGIDAAAIVRLSRRHGSLVDDVLGDARSMADLGDALGGGLFAREVAYFRSFEWACEPDDVLWRRSKSGLHMTPVERAQAVERLGRML